MGPCFNFSIMNYLSLYIVDFNVMVSLYTIIQFQLHYLSLFMFSLFFKKQLLFVLWIFYDCKKKKARKANSHVRWLVMVGSCWCWCSRWLALYDWWLYGITERKPFFLSFMFLCTQTRLVRLSLSLSQLQGGFLLFLRVHDCD